MGRTWWILDVGKRRKEEVVVQEDDDLWLQNPNPKKLCCRAHVPLFGKIQRNRSCCLFDTSSVATHVAVLLLPPSSTLTTQRCLFDLRLEPSCFSSGLPWLLWSQWQTTTATQPPLAKASPSWAWEVWAKPLPSAFWRKAIKFMHGTDRQE